MLLKINYNMKYIKLFEDFNEELDIEDAKQIVISHLGEVKEVEIDAKWNAKDILILDLLEEPTDDQIERCEKHLFPEYEEKGFFLHRIFEHDWAAMEYKFVVGIGRSIEDYCISWLNSNYSDMESVDSESFPGTVLYRLTEEQKLATPLYNPEDNVLLYDETNSKVYVNTNIWAFFEHYFGLDEYEIKEILDTWVKETYNLDVPTTRFGTYYGRFEKCV